MFLGANNTTEKYEKHPPTEHFNSIHRGDFAFAKLKTRLKGIGKVEANFI